MKIVPLLLLFVLGLHAGTSAHAAASDDFRRGVEHYSGGRYELALQAFLDAQRAGLNTATLHFNLGATFYRLGRAEDALAQFGRIAADPEWGPLAHYNMGQIEEGRGRTAAALDHYRIAQARAPEARLVALAAARIEALSAGADPSAGDMHAWMGTVSLLAGHDDNVLLTDSQTDLAPSDEADQFAELFVHAGRYLRGDYERGWRVDLAGYYRSYLDLGDYDSGVGSVRLLYGRALTVWSVDAAGKVEFQSAGNQYLATVGSMSLQGLRTAGPLLLRLRNEFRYYEPGADYDFIGGWQNRLAVELSHRSRSGRLRLGYELELNEREDHRAGSEFTSYSPLRQRLFADLRHALTTRLQVEGRIEWRQSRYSDANLQLDAGSVLTAIERRDDRLAGSLRMTYVTASGWQWFADAQQSDNDSNLSQYAYANRQFGAGVEYAF